MDLKQTEKMIQICKPLQKRCAKVTKKSCQIMPENTKMRKDIKKTKIISVTCQKNQGKNMVHVVQ